MKVACDWNGRVSYEVPLNGKSIQGGNYSTLPFEFQESEKTNFLLWRPVESINSKRAEF